MFGLTSDSLMRMQRNATRLTALNPSCYHLRRVSPRYLFRHSRPRSHPCPPYSHLHPHHPPYPHLPHMVARRLIHLNQMRSSAQHPPALRHPRLNPSRC